MPLSLRLLFLIGPIFALALASNSVRAGAPAVEDHTMTIVIRPAVNLEGPAATEATPSSNDLTLAEIVDPATIPAVDREIVMRHLRAIALTDRPNLGEERTFTQEGLEAIVGEASRRLEAAGYTIEWKIPRRSSVSRKITFSRDAATKLLRDEFATRCGGCDVQMKRIDWPPTENLRISAWHFAFRNDRPRGSFSVPLELDLAEGGNTTSKKTLMVSGQVEFFSDVPVATRAMNAGDKFQASDFRAERRNITYILDAPALAQDFDGSVAARGLAMGEPIWKATLRREQQVRFGDPVRVQSGGETFSVTTDGVAQNPAAIGESVRVKIGKTQKLVSGILKEKGLVEIQ